jgi:hypothetical protein
MKRKDVLSKLTSLIVLLLISGIVLFSGCIEDDEYFDNDKLEFEYPADWTPTNFTAKNTSYSIQLYGNDTDIIFPVTVKTEVSTNNMYTSSDPESIMLRKVVEEKCPEIAKDCKLEYLDKTRGSSLAIFKYKAQVAGKTEIRILFLNGIHFCMIEGKTLKDDYYLEEELEDIAESLNALA